MEKFEETRQKALRNIKIADHMLTQTYPLVNDPKILLTVLENIFLSLTNSMASVLYYERFYKRIPPFHENFDSKYNMFKMKFVDRYNISRDYVTFIGDVKNMIVSHKKSPVEFSRKGVFVICSEDFRMRTLTPDDMKKYIGKAKSFIQEMDSIISRNEAKDERVI